MEELSLEKLAELERQPTRKPRKTKVIERSHRTWFYEIEQHYGTCDNPKCTDNRNKPSGTSMVWTHPSGKNMCRFCWLANWLLADE